MKQDILEPKIIDVISKIRKRRGKLAFTMVQVEIFTAINLLLKPHD